MPVSMESSPLIDEIISELKQVFPHITDPDLWRPTSFANAVKRHPELDHLEEIELLSDYADRHPKYVKAAKDPAARMNTWFMKSSARPQPRKPKQEERPLTVVPTPTNCEPWDEMKELIADGGEPRPFMAWTEIDAMQVELHGNTIIAYSDVLERKDTIAEIVQRYIRRSLSRKYEVQYVSPNAP